MVERCVRDAEAVGSSPVTSTKEKRIAPRQPRRDMLFFFVVDGRELADRFDIGQNAREKPAVSPPG